MSAKPRPTLDSLSDRFARKPAPTAPAAGETEDAPPAPASEKSPLDGGRDKRVQILTRIDPATRKRLKMIAVAPVDAFFERVTVNAEDPALRQNRLALLNALRAATRAVADFSCIEG